ncbi:uncharacterized protein C1orf226 homolog [Pelodiscus sinensis]|uniref:uncharacterized protein C1orf226 homolog n=1 Tax=Pelodiscus sinensis TaxID=13735 RepID=UPI003F6D338B
MLGAPCLRAPPIHVSAHHVLPSPRSPPLRPSVPLRAPTLLSSLPADHSLFENSNTTLAPKLQPSRSVSRALQGPPQAALPDTAGPALRAGSQHLRNLSKAVGAKVNDLLRRREAASLGEAWVTEVNARAGAELVGGTLALREDQAHATGHVLLETFPRLDPPPPAAKRRAPRALKTPLDMLISQPAAGSAEAAGERAAQEEQWKTAGAGPRPGAGAELGAPGVAGPSGAGPPHGNALSVPDLLQEETLQGQLRAAEWCPEKPALRLSLSQRQPCSLDQEGPHPDLLSFE